MVKFVTLFLGLVVGSHEVELMVDDRVAAIELHLDGVSAGRIEEAPWVAAIDFGRSLDPARLEAVAFDESGNELARAAQTLNRPRPRAEAELLLERDERGRPASVRLAWQSSEESVPSEVVVTLDGDPLTQLESDRYRLPTLDLREFHLIQADVHFGSGDRAHAQLSIGGEHVAVTGDRLTAVLISLTGRKRDYDREDLTGWFVADEGTQSVVAFETGPSEVLLVRTPGTASATAGLPGIPISSAGRIPMGGIAVPATSVADRVQAALSLPKNARMRLLEPFGTKVDRGHLSFETFIISPDLRDDGGVLWALMRRFASTKGGDKQPRLVDAVAIAGLQAAMGNRRRAVVLVTAAYHQDVSVLETEAVLGYLNRLGVPLYVWQIGTESGLGGWPQATVITEYRDLRRAVRDLEKELARQRVVWLSGDHAPGSVWLASGAPARVAGASYY